MMDSLSSSLVHRLKFDEKIFKKTMSSTFETSIWNFTKKTLFLQFDCIYLFIYLFKYLLMEPHMFTWARVKVKRHVSALREAPAATWRLETANWKWKGQPGNSERHVFTWGGDFSGCLRVGSTVLQLDLSRSEVANLRSEWLILKNAVSTVFFHNPKVFSPTPPESRAVQRNIQTWAARRMKSWVGE